MPKLTTSSSRLWRGSSRSKLSDMNSRGLVATYIVASGRNGTLYLGSTSDLKARVSQHKQELFEGFSKRYGCKTLVWYEPFEFITTAIRRERTMKHWPRAWKLRVIEDLNPDWRDLWDMVS